MNYVQQLDLIGDRGHRAKVVLKSGEVVGEPWYIDTDYADEDTIVMITYRYSDGNYSGEWCINSEIESIEEIVE